MINAIYKTLGIQTNDSGRLAALGPIFFLTGLAYNLGLLSSQSLFISNFGVAYLPLMYLVEAAILPIQLWAVSRLGQKLPQGSLIKALFLVVLGGFSFCALFALVMIGFNFKWHGFYPLLFIMGSILIRILAPLMWMLGNGTCLLQQAKRLFPILGAFFILGGGCAGLLARMATGYFPGIATEVTLFCVPVILFGSFFLWRRVITKNFLAKDLQVEEKRGEPIKKVIKNVWATPLLRVTLLSFIILMNLYYIIDYQFFVFAIMKYPDSDGLTRFYGDYLVLLQVVSLLVGLFLNRLIKGIGIGKTVTFMGLIAVSVLIGSGCMAVGSNPLAVFVAADIIIDVLAFTLLPMISEVLYKLVPNELRAGTSLFFAGSINAAAKILSSTITGLHSSRLIPLLGLATIGVIMALGYFLLTLKQKGLYFTTLFRSIRSHVVNIEELESFSPGKVLGKKDLIPIQAALESGDPAKELIALEFGAHLRNEALFPALKGFLDHPDPEKRLLALQAIPENVPGFEEYCLSALADPDDGSRSEAIRRMARVIHDRERFKSILNKQLEEPSPEVARETIIALYPYAAVDHNLKNRLQARIEAMLDDVAEARFQVCGVIGAVKAYEYGKRIAAMVAADTAPRVRVAAANCLGELSLVEAIPVLLENYAGADRELKLSIENSLLKMSNGAAAKLRSGLEDRGIEVWSLSVSVLAALDQDRTFAKVLTQSCDEKLKSLRSVNGISEVLAREGLHDLASLYRKRIEESFNAASTACWRVLSSYYDPVLVERLQQTLNLTHSSEKREQGVEILIELAPKFSFTAELAEIIQGRLHAAMDSQLNLAAVLTRAKADCSDHWLDSFADYALKHA